MSLKSNIFVTINNTLHCSSDNISYSLIFNRLTLNDNYVLLYCDNFRKRNNLILFIYLLLFTVKSLQLIHSITELSFIFYVSI